MKGVVRSRFTYAQDIIHITEPIGNVVSERIMGIEYLILQPICMKTWAINENKGEPIGKPSEKEGEFTLKFA